MVNLISDTCYRIQLTTYRFLKKAKIIQNRPLIAPKGSIQKTFYNTPIFAGEDGNDLCKKYLMAGNPCMLGRIGTTEMGTIQAYLDYKAGLRSAVGNASIERLYQVSGFFPATEDAVHRFAEIYIDSAKELDVMGVFNNHAEDYFVKEYAPQAKLVQFTTYEPFYYDHPWSFALNRKKVLVIHPFKDSIEFQYTRREILFDNPEVLPEFELKTIKAVQSLGDNTDGFSDWFEALDYMKNRIDETDYDVALIGCGAYAFPLAAHVKRMGKQSVITAGATQLLFGIKGARWDHAETPVPYKDPWIRPNESEVPKQAETVENGCYW